MLIVNKISVFNISNALLLYSRVIRYGGYKVEWVNYKNY